jgi:hypothetical protein
MLQMPVHIPVDELKQNKHSTQRSSVLVYFSNTENYSYGRCAENKYDDLKHYLFIQSRAVYFWFFFGSCMDSQRPNVSRCEISYEFLLKDSKSLIYTLIFRYSIYINNLHR